jgi:hypothetical protein
MNNAFMLCYVFVLQGDLFDEMKRSMGRMPESQLVTSVLLPMMSALLAMHAAGFIHRDIKPENTLFAANRVLKLAGGVGRYVMMVAAGAIICAVQIMAFPLCCCTAIAVAAQFMCELAQLGQRQQPPMKCVNVTAASCLRCCGVLCWLLSVLAVSSSDMLCCVLCCAVLCCRLWSCCEPPAGAPSHTTGYTRLYGPRGKGVDSTYITFRVGWTETCPHARGLGLDADVILSVALAYAALIPNLALSQRVLMDWLDALPMLAHKRL